MADKKKSPVLAIVTLLTELMNTNFNHLLSTYIILITLLLILSLMLQSLIVDSV